MTQQREKEKVTFFKASNNLRDNCNLNFVHQAMVFIRLFYTLRNVYKRIGSIHFPIKKMLIIAYSTDNRSIRKLLIVEHFIREHANGWSHSILNIEHMPLVPQQHQPLKQTSSKFSLVSNLEFLSIYAYKTETCISHNQT